MIKVTLPEHTKKLAFLREEKRRRGIEFFWDERYSETSEPDKNGRWARYCFVNFYAEEKGQWLIGSITKPIHNEASLGVYNAHCHFPVTQGRDNTFHDILHSEGSAKEFVELLWIEFLTRIEMEKLRFL